MSGYSREDLDRNCARALQGTGLKRTAAIGALICKVSRAFVTRNGTKYGATSSTVLSSLRRTTEAPPSRGGR